MQSARPLAAHQSPRVAVQGRAAVGSHGQSGCGCVAVRESLHVLGTRAEDAGKGITGPALSPASLTLAGAALPQREDRGRPTGGPEKRQSLVRPGECLGAGQGPRASADGS